MSGTTTAGGGNPYDFQVDVSKWVKKAGEQASAAFRAIALDATATVQSLTPVDTGYLRSNWTCIIEGEDAPVAGRVEDPAVAVQRAVIGDTIIITNPVIYARRINYGFVGEDSRGRHYNQQGYHMVEQTVNLMPVIATAAVARVTAQSQ